MNNINQQILNSIHMIVSKSLHDAPYNSMIYGTVVGVHGGKYDVNVDDNVITVSSINGNTYKLSDVVIICVPNNNTLKKFILGKLTD